MTFRTGDRVYDPATDRYGMVVDVYDSIPSIAVVAVSWDGDIYVDDSKYYVARNLRNITEEKFRQLESQQ